MKEQNNIVATCSKGAMAAILSGLMAFGGAVPAFAAAGGSITVNANANNTSVTYDAYQLFTADVNAQDKATNIAWDSNAVKTAVLAFLDDNGYQAWLTSQGHTAAVNGTSAHDLPQNAADYISYMINGSADDTEANTTPATKKGSSFANALARTLAADNTVAPVATITPGTALTGQDQGYYLIVSTDNTIDNTESGTAPIWLALGESAKSITEKSAIPTIAKTVTEDSTGTAGNKADANRQQTIPFQLTGTVAQNANAFEKYYMQFTDSMTGLEMSAADQAGIVVKLDGVDITKYVTGAAALEGNSISYANDTLTVTIADLLVIPNDATQDEGDFIAVDGDSAVTVDYNARLKTGCTIGQTGNPNSVTLTYSSDPSVTSSHDTTNPVTTTTYAYQLTFTKVDEATREALSGAKFTIQVANTNADAASRGKYVQADGTLGDTAYEFTTDGNGQFNVQGIDEGVYTIHETTAAADHTVWASDATLTITRTYNATSGAPELAASISGANGLFQTNPAAYQDGIQGITQASGLIETTASDKRETYLPGTGMTMSQAGVIFGSVCVAVGLVGIVRYKKNQKSEE